MGPRKSAADGSTSKKDTQDTTESTSAANDFENERNQRIAQNKARLGGSPSCPYSRASHLTDILKS
jgi:hypothetical protein